MNYAELRAQLSPVQQATSDRLVEALKVENPDKPMTTEEAQAQLIQMFDRAWNSGTHN